MRLRWAAILGALTVLIATTPVAARTVPAPPWLPLLGHQGRFIANSSGQVVILHGFNVVAKVAPYEPAADGFGAPDAAFLAAHGFNAVRLGVILEGLEATPGHYNAAYLDSIKSTVDLLGRYGIYSLIDFHQDMYNQRFQGEGLPAWMIDDNGLPAEPQTGFPGNYFAMPALNRAFDNFWADTPVAGGKGAQDWYAQAWGHVASALAGDSNVVGYDLLNEPWPGSEWPSCFPPAGCPLFDQRSLAPFYAKVTTAIRAVDRAHLIFDEPALPFDYSAPTYLPKPADTRTGLDFHVYCLAAVGAPETAPTRSVCDHVESTTVGNALAHAAASGGPLVLSEFGATTDATELRTVAELADGSSIPWIEWAFCACGDPTGSANESLVYDPAEPPVGANVDTVVLNALDEPYPQLVGGTPGGYSYDPASRTFSFTYSTTDPAGRTLRSPTVVYVPSLDYPLGYRATVQGARVSSEPGATDLVLSPLPGARTVTLTVTPG